MTLESVINSFGMLLLDLLRRKHIHPRHVSFKHITVVFLKMIDQSIIDQLSDINHIFNHGQKEKRKPLSINYFLVITYVDQI